MRYLGGKGRVAKEIGGVILARTESRGRYVEPFVGGGGMAAFMGNKFDYAQYSDASEDLILMWAALNKGWQPPLEVSEEEHRALRHAEPSALRGLVGFGGSFGGTWFGGYARGGFQSDGSPRNHQGESARRALKDIVGMRGRLGTSFLHQDFREVLVGPGDVVYCDPPYAGVSGYKMGGFPHEEFWRTAARWADDGGAHVFVSEYAAPLGWDCVWERELRSSASRAEKRHVAVERLFTRAENLIVAP